MVMRMIVVSSSLFDSVAAGHPAYTCIASIEATLSREF